MRAATETSYLEVRRPGRSTPEDRVDWASLPLSPVRPSDSPDPSPH